MKLFFPYLQLHVSKPYRLRAFSTSFFTNLTQDQIIILKYTCILKKLTLPPSPCPFFLSNNLISQAHPRSRQGRNWNRNIHIWFDPAFICTWIIHSSTSIDVRRSDMAWRNHYCTAHSELCPLSSPLLALTGNVPAWIMLISELNCSRN